MLPVLHTSPPTAWVAMGTWTLVAVVFLRVDGDTRENIFSKPLSWWDSTPPSNPCLLCSGVFRWV